MVFRNLDPSPAIEALIRMPAAAREGLAPRILGCRAAMVARQADRDIGRLDRLRLDARSPLLHTAGRAWALVSLGVIRPALIRINESPPPPGYREGALTEAPAEMDFEGKTAIVTGGASGIGAAVNMSAILGRVGFATAGAHVAAKHALVGLTGTAALEDAADGIRVNAVGPGFVDTPLLSKNLDTDTKAALAGMHPVGRIGRPEEVSALTCLLLSDRASFVTGSYHLVDGAYTAQ